MNQYANMATITFNNEYNDDAGGGIPYYYPDFPTEYFFYAAIAVIFLMIIALMMKLLWNWEGDEEGGREEEWPTESSGLLSSKEEALYSCYGTSEEDIESSGKLMRCSSSSEDLYDGRICVICYDDQRSCFFIPCGHCITCDNCTQRIMSEESKSCPICRTYINKVRILHIL